MDKRYLEAECGGAHACCSGVASFALAFEDAYSYID
jgi:hypothetical protein